MIDAQIVADSVSPAGKRITTFLLHYPRFVHSEFLTHRAFSRNAASSRAIPVKTMIRRLIDNPALPVYWGAAQKGMQAAGEIPEELKPKAKERIIEGMYEAIHLAEDLLAIGLHKQIANRYLEPWAHMETLVTATEWENFYALRAHKDAQPEFQTLAFAMLREFVNHIPREVGIGQWHIPFGDSMPMIVEQTYSGNQSGDHTNIGRMPTLYEQIKIATARACRTSYMNFDGISDAEADMQLHDRSESLAHWSPFEHCAKAAIDPKRRSGNFFGWLQYRHQFPNQNQKVKSYKELLEEMPEFVKRELNK